MNDKLGLNITKIHTVNTNIPSHQNATRNRDSETPRFFLDTPNKQHNKHSPNKKTNLPITKSPSVNQIIKQVNFIPEESKPERKSTLPSIKTKGCNSLQSNDNQIHKGKGKNGSSSRLASLKLLEGPPKQRFTITKQKQSMILNTPRKPMNIVNVFNSNDFNNKAGIIDLTNSEKNENEILIDENLQNSQQSQNIKSVNFQEKPESEAVIDEIIEYQQQNFEEKTERTQPPQPTNIVVPDGKIPNENPQTAGQGNESSNVSPTKLSNKNTRPQTKRPECKFKQMHSHHSYNDLSNYSDNSRERPYHNDRCKDIEQLNKLRKDHVQSAYSSNRKSNSPKKGSSLSPTKKKLGLGTGIFDSMKPHRDSPLVQPDQFEREQMKNPKIWQSLLADYNENGVVKFPNCGLENTPYYKNYIKKAMLEQEAKENKNYYTGLSNIVSNQDISNVSQSLINNSENNPYHGKGFYSLHLLNSISGSDFINTASNPLLTVPPKFNKYTYNTNHNISNDNNPRRMNSAEKEYSCSVISFEFFLIKFFQEAWLQYLQPKIQRNKEVFIQERPYRINQQLTQLLEKGHKVSAKRNNIYKLKYGTNSHRMLSRRNDDLSARLQNALFDGKKRQYKSPGAFSKNKLSFVMPRESSIGMLRADTCKELKSRHSSQLVQSSR